MLRKQPDMSARQKLYTPIRPYQTRIIRLLGDNGNSDSPLLCSLYPADILHPTFEGIGVRSPSGKEDYLIPYEALSYTWGSGETVQSITCNGIEFPITEIIFQALRELRHSQDNVRYLWIDAICINQSDDKEKSEQVQHMLQIYQKATSVIAWVGVAGEDLKNVIAAAPSFSAEHYPDDAADFWSLYRGIRDLYARPWFQRIWVQQEIFGARDLRLQCGALKFTWSRLLSEPNLLSMHPHLQPYPQRKQKWKIFAAKVPDHIKAQRDAISELDQLHKHQLGCFEQFSTHNARQPDLIDALLHTGTLQSTNPRDYVYGIVSMTGFPAEAMPLQEWRMARQRGVFIPIDYSADIISVMSTVTWVALMKGGLRVLAKFKAFAAESDGSQSTWGQPLPSWVIDWRLAAKLFARKHPQDSSKYEALYNFFGTKVLIPAGGELLSDDVALNLTSAWARRESSGRLNRPRVDLISASKNVLTGWYLNHQPPPAEHEQFCRDNSHPSVPCTKLILRGIIQSRFYVSGSSIQEKRQLRPDKDVFQLQFEASQADLIVYLLGFGDKGSHRQLCEADLLFDDSVHGSYKGIDRKRNGGLWLLRPMENDEFKIIACLSWMSDEHYQLYDHWEWNPEHFRGISSQAQRPTRLLKAPEDSSYLPPSDWESMLFDGANSTAIQKFTIT